MNKSITLAALAAALAVSGCAKKPPKELPPAPAAESTTPPDGSGIENQILPGSRADFLRSVPADRIFFDTDSFSVDDQDRATLDAQAAWLQRNPNVRITIEGHCDERGTREYNLALGDRRANAAKNYLQSRGIDASRMTVISWGKERPDALGSDESAWSRNRRAVTVVPQ
ncbi:MAG TPA: peptidoglycan-associated lipoprotein Pal [Bradyrhizobium sp.]|nr:peptidoglycan-associated lipoprotein Pal [Allosphingosinicella sp.]HKS19898.1 peptidoglycan-associated lipoprotein Pal [Bradyrhizobium sp.]